MSENDEETFCPDELNYYDALFADDESGYGFVSDVDGENGSEKIDFSADMEKIRRFCEKAKVSEESFFASSFAYAVSRFTGYPGVAFRIKNTATDKPRFVKIDCSDAPVEKFVSAAERTCGKCIAGNIPPEYLAERYSLPGNILFSYGCEAENDGEDVSFSVSCGERCFAELSHSKIFSEATSHRFLEAFRAIMLGLTECGKLSEIRYTSESDLKLIAETNRRETKLRFESVLDAFRDSLSKYPESNLLRYLNRKYTYAECDAITDGIAAAISDKDVGRGDSVAFMVPRSEWYFLCSLGIMKTGAVCVPIDDNYPDERVSFMIADSASKVVLCTEATKSRLGKIAGNSELISVDGLSEKRRFEKRKMVRDDPAVILYTSGSTGNPKGCTLTHIGLENTIEHHARDAKIGVGDVYGFYVSVGFDVSMISMYSSMSVGGAVDVIPEDIRFDIKLLNLFIKERGITHTFVTTQVARLFCSAVSETSLKVLVTGGEKLGDVKSGGNYRLLDIYGPTEASVFVLSNYAEDKLSPDSVGIPNANTKLYILDAEKRQVPFGAVGELFISGYPLTPGYVNRPELNEKAFLDNPFTDEEGYGHMYSTGDFFRYLPDGKWAVVGRRDSQVKIRGNRVELTEVEMAIAQMDSVKDVVVRTVTNQYGGKELCAYVVSDSVTSDDIRSYVSGRKPAYMVPAYVVFMEKIPLNMNGKVDWRKLPKPDMDKVRAEYVAPRNETERKLCDAISSVLGLDKTGIDDDFIRLGGDSLKAIMVQNLSKVSSTVDILRFRTPRKISENTSGEESFPKPYTVESGCPLSESQLNVYLDIKAKGKKGAYLIPFLYDIPSGKSSADAEKAIKDVVAAHPVLGSRIAEKSGAPWIVCDSKPEIKKEKLSIDSFDIEKCLSVFSVENGRISALISHIVFDGFSLGVLSDSFSKAFENRLSGTDTGFLVSSAYDEYIKKSDRYSKAGEFYDWLLCDCDVDSSLMRDVGGTVNEVSLELSATYDEVFRKAKEEGISPGVVFTAAYAYAMSRFTGRSDAVFSIAENGRELPGLEESVGMFVRTLPIRIECDNVPVSEFLRKSSDIVYGVMASEIYPFRLLSKKYGVRADAIFQFMGNIDGRRKLSSELKRIEVEDYAMISDLVIAVMEKSGKLEISIVHSAKYSDDTARRMAEAFDKILSGLLKCEKLSDIEFVSDEDIKIFDRINKTQRKLKYGNVLDAYRDTLGRRPDNVLVSYADKSLTYSQCDAVTDAIASALAEKGIGRGRTASVFVSRSERYLLCSLAVLKTGATYVPIDDTYPDERVRHMFTDSNSTAVVCDSVTEERCRRLVSDMNGMIVVNADKCKPKKFEWAKPEGSDPAVILYTSGTTGKPKGSVITHLALINLSEWYIDSGKFGEKDVAGLHSSFTFDMHAMALFPPMVVGASVDIIPDAVRLDIEQLDKYFIKNGVTHTFFATQFGKIFASGKSKSLKVLHIGGEKLGEFDAPEGYLMFEGYGPSENLAYSATIPVAERIDTNCIGRLLYNVKAYILDKEKRRVPMGAVGELHLSGYQLSKGYLNLDELNAKAFIPNPYSDEEGHDRIYATGDFFRFLPDGTLGVIGRRDGQVKIRGNRVELTEVEAAVRDMESVKDVTVQPVVNDVGGKELCVYIVSDGNLTQDDVKAFVAKRKPDYMVPSFVVFLDKIPLNVNGKVDKRALPKPDVSSFRSKYAAPRNEKEKSICDAFSKTLEIEKVGIDDDFVLLGGDSLKAIRLASYCLSAGLSLSIREIITKRTPRMLSECVAESKEQKHFSGKVGLAPIQKLFMSSGTAEQRNWFNQSILLESEDELDVSVLQKAFDAVTDHHDMLRASYGSKYVVREQGITVCDVQSSVFSSKKKMIEYFESGQKSFSLDGGKMIFCSAATLDSGKGKRHFLFVAIHHMIIDGVSWSVLLDDLISAYNSIKAGSEPKFPPVTVSYAEWVGLHRKKPPVREREYWEKVSEIVKKEKFGRKFVPFAKKSRINLKKLSSNPYGLGVVDILFVAMAEAHREIFGKDTVVVRVEGHGRYMADVSRTVGWFTCAYPLALNVNGNLVEDFRSVRKALNDVPRGGIGYGILNEEMDLPGFTFNYLSNAFLYRNGKFRSVSDIPRGREFSHAALGDAVSFNVTETETGFTLSGYHDGSQKYSELADSFVEKVKEISSFMDKAKVYECPLSETQLNIYLEDIKYGPRTAFSVPGVVNVPNEMSDKDVIAAINRLLDAHPVLRGRVEIRDGVPWVVTDGKPEIVVGPSYGFIRPFDLGKYFARFRLVRENGKAAVIFDMHHIVLDASSRRILIRDFRSLLAGKEIVRETGFLKVYSRLEASDVRESFAVSKKFFDGKFAGRDNDMHVTYDVSENAFGTLCIPISVSKKKLEDFANANRTTAGAVLTAAFAYMFSKYVGKERVCFATIDNGRNVAGAENAIGSFVRTMACAADCSEKDSKTFLEKFSGDYLEMISNGNYPFRKTAEDYGFVTSTIFEYVSDYNNDLNSEQAAANFGILTNMAPPESGVETDFFFAITATEDVLFANLLHSNKYSDRSAKSIIASYDAVISGLVSGKDLPSIEYVSREDAENALSRSGEYGGEGTKAYVLDSELRIVPPGAVGKLYLSKKGMSEACFENGCGELVDNPFGGAEYGKMFFTGNHAVYSHGGAIRTVEKRKKPRRREVEYAKPSSGLEKALCSAFSSIFGTSVGADDDFFALGGTSLNAVYAAFLVNRKKDYGVVPRDVFAWRTPRKIAEAKKNRQ